MNKIIKEQVSDIGGTGYGSDHNWKRGETNQHPISYSDKFTRYHCRNCDATFNHYYDVTPNIFDNIKGVGISDKCPKK